MAGGGWRVVAVEVYSDYCEEVDGVLEATCDSQSRARVTLGDGRGPGAGYHSTRKVPMRTTTMLAVVALFLSSPIEVPGEDRSGQEEVPGINRVFIAPIRQSGVNENKGSRRVP